MKIRDVCLSGGGYCGFYQLGCMDVVRDTVGFAEGLRVAGTSCGAIVGLCVALGIRGSDVVRAALETGTSDLFKGSVSRLFEGLGMDDGSKLFGKVADILGGLWGSDLRTLSLRGLRELTGVSLTAVATCLETRSAERLGPDTHPDLGVMDAVRMSSSVPIVFEPVRHSGKTYLDGGLSEYFPASHLDQRSKDAIGVCMKKVEASVGPGLPGLLKAAYESTLSIRYGLRWTLYAHGNVMMFDSGISPEDVKRLYELGRSDMRIFLEGLKED